MLFDLKVEHLTLERTCRLIEEAYLLGFCGIALNQTVAIAPSFGGSSSSSSFSLSSNKRRPASRTCEEETRGGNPSSSEAEEEETLEQNRWSENQIGTVAIIPRIDKLTLLIPAALPIFYVSPPPPPSSVAACPATLLQEEGQTSYSDFRVNSACFSSKCASISSTGEAETEGLSGTTHDDQTWSDDKDSVFADVEEIISLRPRRRKGNDSSSGDPFALLRPPLSPWPSLSRRVSVAAACHNKLFSLPTASRLSAQAVLPFSPHVTSTLLWKSLGLLPAAQPNATLLAANHDGSQGLSPDAVSCPSSSSSSCSPAFVSSTCASSFTVFRRITVVLDSAESVASVTTSQKNRKSSLFQNFDLIALRPTTEAAWKAACLSSDCDLISLPLCGEPLSSRDADGRARFRLPFPIRRSTVCTALQRGIFFEMELGDALRDSDSRMALLQNLPAALRFLPLHKVVITSGARNPLELRAPSDLTHLSWTLWLGAGGLGTAKERQQRRSVKLPPHTSQQNKKAGNARGGQNKNGGNKTTSGAEEDLRQRTAATERVEDVPTAETTTRRQRTSRRSAKWSHESGHARHRVDELRHLKGGHGVSMMKPCLAENCVAVLHKAAARKTGSTGCVVVFQTT